MIELRNMPKSFRTDEMNRKYKEYQESGGLSGACVLCEREPIEVFMYWKIIQNEFPYDTIAEIHEMIVPLRHVTESYLTQEEQDEFKIIKESRLQQYNYIMEATMKRKSIPAHFHLHLITN